MNRVGKSELVCKEGRLGLLSSILISNSGIPICSSSILGRAQCSYSLFTLLEALARFFIRSISILVDISRSFKARISVHSYRMRDWKVSLSGSSKRRRQSQVRLKAR